MSFFSLYLLAKSINCLNDGRSIFNGKDWTDGKAQFRLMDFLRNGKMQPAPFHIALLQMGRYGVMDLSLYALT